jgi:uncharacterized membrane protein YgcG
VAKVRLIHDVAFLYGLLLNCCAVTITLLGVRQAVGDDLEMNEFGNMYTTGGNAAPGNGGGIFTSGFAGGGGRRGGGAKGKATEAQTWLVWPKCG